MKHKIINQKNVSILTISEDISKLDAPLIEACTKELAEMKSSLTIINFKEVNNIDNIVLRELTVLQHEIRKSESVLKIVGLKPAVKNYLIDKGVIRQNEIKSTLDEALKSL